MRTLIFIGTLFISFSSLLAQSAEEERIRLMQQVDQQVLSEADKELPVPDKKMPGHWNFSVGTSYSYMKGYGSGMMFYTTPSYILPLNNRWALHGGVVAGHYVGLNYLAPAEIEMPGSFSSLSVFAAATYRMTDRLVVHGAGMKQLVSGPITPFTPYPMDDLSVGASYKIGNNFTIGASVHMRNANGYYHAPTFGSPFFPSSIGW